MTLSNDGSELGWHGSPARRGPVRLARNSRVNPGAPGTRATLELYEEMTTCVL